MALFAARDRRNLVRWLRRGDVRLLLPADPGQEQMLEHVYLFNPRARPASRGGILVEEQEDVYVKRVYLSRGYAIEPDVAAEADVPDGMGAAFFVSLVSHAQPYSWSDSQRVRREQNSTARRLVNGLALRLGGIGSPKSSVLGEPLRATIYTAREVTAGQVHEIVAEYAPRLASYHNPTFGPYGVSMWRTSDRQFEAQHWPKGTVHALLPHEPRAVGDLYLHTNKLTAARLELVSPANATDPNTARLLGRCALEIAAMADGVCVDQLGFRVRYPDEFVFG